MLGKAVYRPSGRLLRIDAAGIESGTGAPDLWVCIPPPQSQRPAPTRMRPAEVGKRGVAAFFATWPGAESDAELACCTQPPENLIAVPEPVYLLDPSVLLHLIRGNALGKHVAWAFGLLNAINRPLASIVTHGELPRYPLPTGGEIAGARSSLLSYAPPSRSKLMPVRARPVWLTMFKTNLSPIAKSSGL